MTKNRQKKGIDAINLDSNMSVQNIRDDSLHWLSPPILVVSKIPYATENFYPDALKLRIERLNVQQSTVKRLQTAGDANVHFLDGGALLGDTLYEECTVDGVHPNDLGFLRIAESLEPVIRNFLRDCKYGA